MKLYTGVEAEMLEEHEGTPWRPANPAERMAFFCEHTGECKGCAYFFLSADDKLMCETQALQYRYDIDSDMYPIELQIGRDGQPCCRRKTMVPHGVLGLKGNFRDASGKLFLVRCPRCQQENWGPAVATGKCAWCGWKE